MKPAKRILDDLAKHPDSTPREVKRRLGRLNVLHTLQALNLLRCELKTWRDQARKRSEALADIHAELRVIKEKSRSLLQLTKAVAARHDLDIHDPALLLATISKRLQDVERKGETVSETQGLTPQPRTQCDYE